MQQQLFETREQQLLQLYRSTHTLPEHLDSLAARGTLVFPCLSWEMVMAADIVAFGLFPTAGCHPNSPLNNRTSIDAERNWGYFAWIDLLFFSARDKSGDVKMPALKAYIDKSWIANKATSFTMIALMRLENGDHPKTATPSCMLAAP